METNTLTVSDKSPEIISLSPVKITLKNVNWINEPTDQRLLARIRYRGEKLPITLSLVGKSLAVEFDKSARGLSPGQSIVFYNQDICLGGAVIGRIIS